MPLCHLQHKQNNKPFAHMQSSSQGLNHRPHFLSLRVIVWFCVFFYVGLGFGGERKSNGSNLSQSHREFDRARLLVMLSLCPKGCVTWWTRQHPNNVMLWMRYIFSPDDNKTVNSNKTLRQSLLLAFSWRRKNARSREVVLYDDVMFVISVILESSYISDTLYMCRDLSPTNDTVVVDSMPPS